MKPRLLLFTMIVVAAVSAAAQNACDDALARAHRSYDEGAFDVVLTQLEPCLTAHIGRRAAIDTHRLLALTYLYTDEPEKARKAVSTLLRLDPTFAASSPAVFAALLAEVRGEEQVTQVASVSKTNESLREAPATVVVVTAEEIQRRGYVDLEQLLHDLPGFDISRLNGEIYSLIYQRGYRSPHNDRLLLLIDGVEQNELSTNRVYLSRQYSLTNVDRVEIIYGPASTMYGANAYTGVISIITKEPDALVRHNGNYGVVAQTTYGGYGTRTADLTLAGRNRSGTVSWSVTGNFQRSDERDLSHLDEYDYTYRNVDYRRLMRIRGSPALEFVRRGGCDETSPYWVCSQEEDGGPVVELTEAGEEHVREIDRSFVAGTGAAFTEGAQNWSFFGKFRVSNLTVGIDTWSSREQLASTVLAAFLSGSSSWSPHGTAVYAKYSVPLERLRLNVFLRYEHTGVKRSESRTNYLHHYSSGYLGLLSLVPPCSTPRNPHEGCPSESWMENIWSGTLSSQLRSEANVVYEPSERWSSVAGVEFAKSAIQTSYDITAVGIDFDFFQPVEQVGHSEYALYAQSAWKVRPSLKAVLAGRLSHHRAVDKPGGSDYGVLFTPRAGLIWSPLRRSLVFKAIYAEAFEDPPDYQKFGTLADVNDFPSENLTPEKVRNLELSAGWSPRRDVSVEAAAFQSHYTDVIAFGPVSNCGNNDPTDCLQYQNRDELRVRGLQVSARYRRGFAELWGHYTYTDPVQPDPLDLDGNPYVDGNGKVLDEIAVADIARHRAAIGTDLTWNAWRLALRANHTGTRRAGFGTTAPGNPYREFASHQTAAVTLSYDPRPDTRIQLLVHNVFDTQYYDPGVEHTISASRVLQGGRAVYLRLIYGVW